MNGNIFLEKLFEEREVLIKTKKEIENIKNNKINYFMEINTKEEIKELKEKIMKKNEKFLNLKEKIYFFKKKIIIENKNYLKEEYKLIIERINNLEKPNLKFFLNLENEIINSKNFIFLNEKIINIKKNYFYELIKKIFNKSYFLNEIEISSNIREVILIEKLICEERYLFTKVLGKIYKETFLEVCPLKNNNTDVMYLEWEFENLDKQLRQIYPLLKLYCTFLFSGMKIEDFSDIFYNKNYNKEILLIFRLFLEKIGEIFSLKLTQIKSINPEKFHEYFKRYIFFCESLYKFFKIRLKNPLIVEYLMDIEINNINNILSLALQDNLVKIPESFKSCIDDLHDRFSHAYLYDFSIFMRFNFIIKRTFYNYMNQLCNTIKEDYEITRLCIVLEILDEFNENMETNLFKMLSLYPFSSEYYFLKHEKTTNKEHLEIVNICLQNILSKLRNKIDIILSQLFEGKAEIFLILKSLKANSLRCSDLIKPLDTDIECLLKNHIDNQLDHLFRNKIHIFREKPYFYQIVSNNLKKFCKEYPFKLNIHKLMKRFEKS